MTPSEIINTFFSGTNYLVKAKQYHSALPKELAPWYCYTMDVGHSILALIKGEFDNNDPLPINDMCPCPVKAVLRKYEMVNGYPVAPLVYNSEEGLITMPEDDEF